MQSEIYQRWVSKQNTILHYTNWLETETRENGLLNPSLSDDKLLERITRKLEQRNNLSPAQLKSYSKELLARLRKRFPKPEEPGPVSSDLLNYQSLVQDNGSNLVQESRDIVQDSEVSDQNLVQEQSKGYLVWKRCGKNCHCNSGKGHGPYRYKSIWVNGKVKTQYLGSAGGSS